MFYLETVSSDTLGLLKRLQALPVLSRTRLVGGTALALQLGHRRSVDLDFFGEWDEVNVQPDLETCGSVVRTGGTSRLQFYEINGVKVDLVTYAYGWLEGCVSEAGVRLAHVKDIAAMKLEAVTNRGSRKDFVDIAFLLKMFTLEQMLDLYQRKYPNGLRLLVMRSLAYFDDAETTDMPVMLKPMAWEDVKERIRDAVREIGRNVNET